MSWGMCVCFKKAVISSVTFVDCKVIGSYIFPLPLLSLSLSFPPCEIDRLFVRSSNAAGERFRALLATRAEQKCCWGKR